MARTTCPHCGYSWEYRGRAAPGQYICCPACSSRFIRPRKAIRTEEATGVPGPCQRCGETCDDLHLVRFDDGEVLLACESCVKEGTF